MYVGQIKGGHDCVSFSRFSLMYNVKGHMGSMSVGKGDDCRRQMEGRERGKDERVCTLVRSHGGPAKVTEMCNSVNRSIKCV